MDTQLLIRIGADPRWLFGGMNLSGALPRGEDKSRRCAGTLLANMLSDYLDQHLVGQLYPSAARLSLTSQQVAIRQYTAAGVQSAFAPKKKNRSRPSILKRIQRLLDVHEGHANRVMNGLGILVAGPTTSGLADHYWHQRSNFMRELDIGLIQQLACGSGEHLHALMLKPYQFFANAACAALRLRIGGDQDQQSIEAKLQTKRAYPPFEHALIQSDVSAIECLTPVAKVSLYGLAMWQSISYYLDTDDPSESPRPGTQEQYHAAFDEATLSRVIRYAATETPWVFPELYQIELGAHAASRLPENDLVLLAQRRQQAQLQSAQADPRYKSVVRQAIEELALEVGKALCGISPYNHPLGELSDAAG